MYAINSHACSKLIPHDLHAHVIVRNPKLVRDEQIHAIQKNGWQDCEPENTNLSSIGI